MTVYKYRINEIKLNLKEDKKYLVDKLAKKGIGNQYCFSFSAYVR